MTDARWSTFKSILTGGASELGQRDLLRRVVDEILKLRSHGDLGLEVLPAEVEVHIGVAEGSVQVLERFVQHPAFDKEVGAMLLNRLVRLQEDQLPVRHYVIGPAERTSVEVKERPARPFLLRLQGGDRDGIVIPLPAARRDFLLGRGQWHGDDQLVANDVVVAEGERAVSRRAARLHRSGAFFELEAVDQREALSVLRPDGERLRPYLSASGRVPVHAGDVIEFTDGARRVLSLQLQQEGD